MLKKSKLKKLRQNNRNGYAGRKNPNESRSKDSEILELTGMPVCFGARLYGYRNRDWTYVTASYFYI